MVFREVTQEEFLERAKAVHGDRFDYSKAQYTGMLKKVIIICSVHGEFQQTPQGHIKKKYGCAKCVRYVKMTTESFTERARKVHGDKYDYSTVDYKNCRTLVVITCREHGSFKQLGESHLNGSGCFECAYRTRRPTLQDFLLKARRAHSDKYDYSKITELGKSFEKVTIICKKHGDFQQLPSAHLRGSGCRSCSIERLAYMKKKVPSCPQESRSQSAHQAATE